MEQQANATCGDDTQCLFDVAATGMLDIGQVSVDTGNEIEEDLQLQIPGIYTKNTGQLVAIIIIIIMYNNVMGFSKRNHV